MKKLLLFVVDACTSRVLAPAVADGRLPALRELVRAGELNESCSAIFPSITPAGTASILTGVYPRDHGIAGAYWYDTDEDKVDYFGERLRVVAAEGIKKFFNDFLVRLNEEKLQAETLFQIVERSGLRAANLNHIIFRGDVPHQVNVPLMLALIPGLPYFKEVHGPSIMYLGDFLAATADTPDRDMRVTGGAFNSFGIEDDYTAKVLLRLARDRALPDFTVAYFPDYDTRAHQVGPEAALSELVKLDQHIGELFYTYGGMNQMLDELCVVLTADHAQTNVIEGDRASIYLNETLAEFEIADAGESWDADDEIMICPNMRVAMIYFRFAIDAQLETVVWKLLDEIRIDQVIWRAGLVRGDRTGYHVATRERGELLFYPGASGPETARDQQGCTWSWQGDLRTVDGRVSDDGVITFPQYPNAFERIVCGLEHRTAGDVWVTARVGHEFRLPRTGLHSGGGSHGSLHKDDSIIPLLIAGAPKELKMPAHPRTVDVAPLCLKILGIEPPREVGASHVRTN